MAYKAEMIVFFTILSIAIANLLPIQKDTLINQCLEQIAFEYFDQNDLIMSSVEEVKLNIPNPILHFNAEIRFYFKRFDIYIIEIVGCEVLQDKLSLLSSSRTWNSRAKFIILIHNYYESVFDVLAGYMIYDVIIVNFNNSSVYDIITYFPFDDNTDVHHFKVLPRKIGLCNNGNVTNMQELFLNKLPKIWHNTTIKAEFLLAPPYILYLENNLSGLEMELVKLAANQMKFKIDFEMTQGHGWGFNLPNGTYTSTLGDLQRGKCELVLGLFPANDSFSKDFDMSFTYVEDHLVWAVPKAKLLLAWTKLVHIFNFQSWMLIFAMLIIISFTFYTISYDTSDSVSVWHSFESTYLILLASAAFKVPRNFRVRVIFIGWYIFALILKADFDASFISTLMTDSHEKQIETQKEMISAKLKLGYLFICIDYYKYSNDPKDIYIYKNAEDCGFKSNCLDRVAFDRNYAHTRPRMLLNYLIDLHYVTPQGYPLIHTVKDEVTRITSHVYMKKGLPLFPQFDRTLIYAKSAGFNKYWESMLNYIIKLKHNSFVKAMSTVESHVLGVNQLFSSFVFLFMGLMLSIVVFCLELLWNKWKYMRRIKLNLA